MIGENQNDLLLRLMSASSLRAKVIAGNLANQNTPGFKRREVRFEQLLSQQLERGSADLSRVPIEVSQDETTPARPDGNNVEAEAEVAAMRENLLRYQLYSTIFQGQNNLLEAAINGDR